MPYDEYDKALAETEAMMSVLTAAVSDSHGLRYTETIDLEYVISGEFTPTLDHGSKTVAIVGDTIIHCGERHQWRTRRTSPPRCSLSSLAQIPTHRGMRFSGRRTKSSHRQPRTDLGRSMRLSEIRSFFTAPRTRSFRRASSGYSYRALCPPERFSKFGRPNYMSGVEIVRVVLVADQAGPHQLGDEHLRVPIDQGSNARIKLAS